MNEYQQLFLISCSIGVAMAALTLMIERGTFRKYEHTNFYKIASVIVRLSNFVSKIVIVLISIMMVLSFLNDMKKGKK